MVYSSVGGFFFLFSIFIFYSNFVFFLGIVTLSIAIRSDWISDGDI